jgi:mycoredoxin
MRCEVHGLAAGPDGTCVRCRAGAGPRGRGASGLLVGGLAAVAIAFVAVIAIARASLGPRRDAHPAAVAPTMEPLATGGPALATAATGRAAGTDRTGAASGGRAAQHEVDVRQAMRSVQTTVYTTSWCGYCKRGKAWLSSHDQPYVERDIEADPSARAMVQRISGGTAVPVFDIDGTVVRGFDPGALSSTLRAAAERRAPLQ